MFIRPKLNRTKYYRPWPALLGFDGSISEHDYHIIFSQKWSPIWTLIFKRYQLSLTTLLNSFSTYKNMIQHHFYAPNAFYSTTFFNYFKFINWASYWNRFLNTRTEIFFRSKSRAVLYVVWWRIGKKKSVWNCWFVERTPCMILHNCHQLISHYFSF